ncbi:MAG: preprotein translocase subunit SecA [Gammaproteobacteria bacterium]|nr:preprotein translocase subunit SecA [Gammaproteobacteria bacterium]MCP4088615.1 preprotein translocase subunit SecA [Gammaproteobacteria bacterium]MCP4276477.1 preprotein translocase subunit SecA [Gammaproteobacteria bacterium]MCP4832354.1 preprotein translocase subunit SecA [Gammaproteobacteria bacterium]MCP4929132.1 preprotein translocase subunit SecA [Gammaproteobacteria bacterium]
MANILTKLFGSRNQRLLRDYGKIVTAANGYADAFEQLSDDDVKAKTSEFRQRLQEGEDLDSILPEAFAIVRESARRTLGLRHFDEQFLGGLTLHEGKIAEMRTGEGKTLVATLPAYVNALGGDSVHIVTVNDYLASRDAEWMAPVYEFLGMRVGVIASGQNKEEKRAAYEADIVYGTNNEFGFDYLRDNLEYTKDGQVQRRLAFAIVDEVDSILIDEARTPLIISGPSEERTELYGRINKLIPKLKLRKGDDSTARNSEIATAKVSVVDQSGKDLGIMPLEQAIAAASAAGFDLVEPQGNTSVPVCHFEESGDYTVDEKSKQAFLTEDGHDKVEILLAKEGLLERGSSLYDAANIRLMHHLTAAMRAHAVFKKDVEYIINNGEVVIVDEFTGRTMPGRRWSDGLHQAIEAKEGVQVKEENQTVASITFQNFFRMYGKLSGMTGTADTEAYEFQQIYGLEVVVIPTHRPMVRDDQPDLVHLTQADKFVAISEDIQDCVERGQPVLVGTTSIETSELLAKQLKKEGIAHEVLNAKQHEREAHIVEEAGRPGAVTIATNMAGRGTDIVLGGNFEAELAALGEGLTEAEITEHRKEWEQRHQAVLDSGGLHIIGTERHESRRIDNQLRGRSGRQGDAGSSRFYLSMEDSLMRIFGDPERTKALLSRVGMRGGEAIESGLLTRQIERAQRKVEAHNFDARKSLLEYDDVANDQRQVIYEQRNELMTAEEIADSISGIREEVVNVVIDEFIPQQSMEETWDVPGLTHALEREFNAHLEIAAWLEQEELLGEDALRERIVKNIEQQYDTKVAEVGEPLMRIIEKEYMLKFLDMHWREHLGALDYLRQGIGLRSYAQKNPKQEYKREAFEMFGTMLDQVKHELIGFLARVKVKGEEDVQAAQQRPSTGQMQFQHAEASALAGASAPVPANMPQATRKPGGKPLPPPPQPQADPAAPFVREAPKIGRNEPCHCGSGKKFKHCHGKLS